MIIVINVDIMIGNNLLYTASLASSELVRLAQWEMSYYVFNSVLAQSIVYAS